MQQFCCKKSKNFGVKNANFLMKKKQKFCKKIGVKKQKFSCKKGKNFDAKKQKVCKKNWCKNAKILV